MDVEAAPDFKALRAKFQNDSNLANKLVQAPKKLPPGAPPRLGSGGNAVSSPLPPSKREVIILKPKDEPAHPAQPSAPTQRTPLVWPRARPGYLKPTRHCEEHKGTIVEKGLRSLKNSPEKPPPSDGTDRHGSAQTAPEGPPLLKSFHCALQVWENTSSRGEKVSAVLPTQRAANLYVHPCPEQRARCAPAAPAGGRMQPSPRLDLLAQKQDAVHGNGLALPQAPRGHRGSNEAAAESVAPTATCQLGRCAPREQPQHQKELEAPFCQPRAGKWSENPRSKWPGIKPLPSAESLGPAPRKPARPPRFDLSPFQSSVSSVHRGNETTAAEEDYLTPESAQLEEQHNYEETATYLNQSGDTTTLSVIEVPKAEPEEHKKQKDFFLAKSSPGRAIIKDETEAKTSVEREKQEAKNVFEPGGNEYEFPSSQAKEDGRGGRKVPEVGQDVTSTHTAKQPAPQGLAKGSVEQLRYVSVGAPKPGAEGVALNQNTWQSLPRPEVIYDDVEKMQDRCTRVSDASSPFASASISGNSCEETYEDVEIGSDNPAKAETEKQKRFGNLFKLEKLKLKNIRLKENLRLFSISVPNLAAASQEEDTVYDDVEVWQRELREKDKTWMSKFLLAKEDKNPRKSSDDVERNIFKFKKGNAEKSKKMEKEEKFFRETFMYDKEINVINTATAECSVPSKRRVDLPVTAGEQLDVIDVTEGNAVICRNSEGRYGYVLVEHLNFR